MNNEILELTEDLMEKAVEAVEKRFTTVRAGRANPSILDGVMVEYYGVPTPLKQLATISIPEARQIQIKPFDKSCLHNIEKGIFEADLGLTPGNDGESIRIVIPALTEDRRKELIKQVKAISEEGKVSIRNIRRESIEDLEKEKLPEDEQKALEKEIQELVNEYNKKIDEKLKEKEEELLSV
jgi:ribosome recycling factor